MKISVCIPTYNQAAYLELAIRSAVQQTYPPTEIVISNDCSTDNTKDVLQHLMGEIPNLKIINQPVNLGINRNVDTCLRLCSGDLIVKLDSDDYLAPSYIEKLAKLLLKHPDAGYAHAAVQEIDQNGNFVRLRRLARKAVFISSDQALLASTRGYQVAANIIMFRRSALEKVGFISSNTNFAEDYHLSASLAASGFGNVYQDETLSFYRVWSDAGMVRQRRKLDEIIGIRKVFEEVLEPAFHERGWNLQKLQSSRINFACRHADCLTWNVYNAKEKAELAIALKNLSSAPKAKFFIWLYLNGLGNWLLFFINLESKIKSMLKIFLFRFWFKSIGK